MFLRFGLLFVTVWCLTDAQFSYYDCRRPGTPCAGTCLTTGVNGGTCQCGADTTGYDCSLAGNPVTNLANCNNANCNASPGSLTQFCYTPPSQQNDECACNAGFFGASCQTPRVRVTCEPNSMDVFINPLSESNFAGRVYVKGFSTDSACNFQPDSNFQYSQSIILGTCGASPVVNVANGVTRFTIQVVVQHNSLIETFIDEEHTVICSQFTDGTITGSVGVIAPSNRPGDTVTGQAIGVARMEIRRESNNALVGLSSQIPVGEPLSINILLDSSLYQDLLVTQCIAYNGPASQTNRQQVVLVQGSCPTTESIMVVRPPMTKTNRVVTIPIEAFRFPESNTLYFECDVLVCVGTGETKCAQQTCTTGLGPGVGRKKRQADSPDDKVGASFRIISRDADVEVTCPASTHTMEPCVQSSAFIAITSVFGAFLLVVLVAAIVVCFRFTKGQGSKNDSSAPMQYVNKGMSTA